jgi:hypothetical protein
VLGIRSLLAILALRAMLGGHQNLSPRKPLLRRFAVRTVRYSGWALRHPLRVPDRYLPID